MLEILLAIILISALLMTGIRRIQLLNQSFAVQAAAISIFCLALGLKTGEIDFFILSLLTLITKVIVIPLIIRKSTKNLKVKRELEPIVNGFWSYIIAGIVVVITYFLFKHSHNELFKTGIILMIIGTMLMIARKKIVTQMVGFLVIENGLVLFEISTVSMQLIIELGIILEVLVLALIMGIMVFRINKTLDTVNTDYLSNLKG